MCHPLRKLDPRSACARCGATTRDENRTEVVGAVSKNLTAEQVAQGQAEQREGLAKLRDWFNDWGTTLRPVFSARAQIRLGLTVLTREKEELESAPPAPPIA